MRVLFDHQIFSLQDAGGASRYFYELVRHLQATDSVHMELALGLNNSVFPFGTTVNSRTHVFESRSRLPPGVFRYLVNEIFSNALGPVRGLFDIYHPTLYRAIPWIRRQRMVVTHHDCTHELFPQLFRNAATVIRNKRRLYDAADAIICVSESARRDLIRFYPVAEKRTHVIHHGFAPFAESARGDANSVPQIAPYILFVGARGTYKNFMSLLQAYKDSGTALDYELVAVGGGEFSAIEREKINQLGISERVRLIAKASDQVLAEMYRNAALFVYPSLYEGFGFPPLEAMSVGCPVLAAKTSCLPEICGEAAFYFDAEIHGSLGAALQKLLSDCCKRAALKEKGYQQVALYSWARSAAQTLKVYRDVLEE